MLTMQIRFNPQDIDETTRAIELFDEQKQNLNVVGLVPISNLIDGKCLNILTYSGFEYTEIIDGCGCFYKRGK